VQGALSVSSVLFYFSSGSSGSMVLTRILNIDHNLHFRKALIYIFLPRMPHNGSGMNSCRTGYYSADYFGFFNFSSIFKSLMLLGNYLCRHVGGSKLLSCKIATMVKSRSNSCVFTLTVKFYNIKNITPLL
jgi:hypothetical protein